LKNFSVIRREKRSKNRNISAWRRTVCGDLSSAFRQYNGEKVTTPDFIDRDPFIESIHKAKFKKEPADYRALSNNEIAEVNKAGASFFFNSGAGKGNAAVIGPSYELYVDSKLDPNKRVCKLYLQQQTKYLAHRQQGHRLLCITVVNIWAML
jgi:phospholipase C